MTFIVSKSAVINLDDILEIDIAISELVDQNSNSIICQVVSPDQEVLVVVNGEVKEFSIDNTGIVESGTVVSPIIPSYVVLTTENSNIRVIPSEDIGGIVILNFGTVRG